jgi:hypothetical protein
MKAITALLASICVLLTGAFHENVLAAGGQNAGITTYDIKTPGKGLCC